MLKEFKYELFDEYSYIPIHLYTIMHYENDSVSNSGYFYKSHIEPVLINKIINFINKSSCNNFILDFSRIHGSLERGSFIRLHEILDNNSLIFINLDNDTLANIDNSIPREKMKNIGEFLFSNNSVTEEFIKKISNFNSQIMNEKIENEKKNYLRLMFNKHAGSNQKPLKSSNIYTNKYIDVKKMFYDFPSFMLLIYELSIIIDKNFTGDKVFDCFLCVSNNGSAIGTVLGQLFNKDVTYIMNLGPNLKIKSEGEIDKIRRNVKYLFLFDFICLGTEYKYAYSLVDYKCANLIGGVGPSKYLHPFRFNENIENYNIFTIFDINEDISVADKFIIFGELEAE